MADMGGMRDPFGSVLSARGFAWIAACCLCANVYALNPQKAITHYSHGVWRTADGLPQDSVRAIAQTRDGYLWLGTQAGLARFDGVHFTVFDRLNSPLKTDHVLTLCASRDGSLWIGLGDFGGLFHWTARDGIRMVLSGFHVRALFEDRDGVLWMGAQGQGLMRVSGTDIRTLTHGKGALDEVRAIVQDRAGKLWLGTQHHGVYSYDGHQFMAFGAAQGMDSRDIWALWLDGDGTLWMGSKGKGLFRARGGGIECFTTANGLSS